MSKRTGFFTKNFSQTINAVRRMASPEGTSVRELADCLSLTRRSVFRLLRGIEKDMHIPVIVKRKTFGGMARYCLPKPFVGQLSQINLPRMNLTFDEALSVYLLTVSGSLHGEGNDSRFRLLHEIFEPLGKERKKGK